MYRGDIRLGDTLDFKFTTRRFSTGAPFTLAGSPVLSAYPDNSTTELTAGITLTVDFDSRTGLNHVRIVASGGNGYAAGSNYDVVITTGTVDGVSVVGEVVGSFSIEKRSALMPTTGGRTLDVSAAGEAGLDWANIGAPTTTQNLSGTSTKAVEPTVAGRTLDVSAGGEAGLDWANIGSPTTVQGLSGTTIKDVTDVETKLGTPAGASVSADIAAIESQTDDIGAAGAGLTAIPWNAAWDAEVQSEVQDAIEANHLDHLLAVDYDPAAKPGTATALLNELVESDAGVSRFTANALEQAPTGAGGDGSAFTAIPWNAAWDAEVQSEVDDALVAQRLDELLNADSDIDGAAPPTVGSVFHELLTKTAGSFTYDQATDSLEAVRDNMGTPQTGDSFARLGAPAGASVSEDIAAIEAQTDDIGAAGAGLSAVPWNAAWDAEVQSEVADALDAAVPGSPTAGSLNERIKTMDDADMPARMPAALSSGRMRSDVEALNAVAGSAANLERAASVIVRGAAIAGTLSTTEMTTDLTEATDDHYIGMVITWTSGVLLGQSTVVTDYVGATKKLVYTAVTEAPSAGDTFVLR